MSGSLGKLEQEIGEPLGYVPTAVASMRNWYCEFRIADFRTAFCISYSRVRLGSLLQNHMGIGSTKTE